MNETVVLAIDAAEPSVDACRYALELADRMAPHFYAGRRLFLEKALPVPL